MKKETNEECPDCGGDMKFGIVKLLDGSYIQSVWFCENCIYPFYGKDYFEKLKVMEIQEC